MEAYLKFVPWPFRHTPGGWFWSGKCHWDGSPHPYTAGRPSWPVSPLFSASRINQFQFRFVRKKSQGRRFSKILQGLFFSTGIFTSTSSSFRSIHRIFWKSIFWTNFMKIYDKLCLEFGNMQNFCKKVEKTTRKTDPKLR